MAPSVRAGEMQRYLFERRRCATICAGPAGLMVIEGMGFPALTDGATNCQSFGPKGA
jgi:hypothetical protein